MVRKNAVTRVHGSYYSRLWDPAYIFFFLWGTRIQYTFIPDKKKYLGRGGRGREVFSL